MGVEGGRKTTKRRGRARAVVGVGRATVEKDYCEENAGEKEGEHDWGAKREDIPELKTSSSLVNLWENESTGNHAHQSEDDVETSCLHREPDFNVICEIVFLLTAFFSVRFECKEREHWQE